MNDSFPPEGPRRWSDKFRDAFRGIAQGVRGQSSFAAHLLITLLVIAVAAAIQVRLWEWAVLTLCMALVLTAEMFNSALEHLAKAVDREFNPHLGAALDIASGAVLIAALGAAIVGFLILLPACWRFWFG